MKSKKFGNGCLRHLFQPSSHTSQPPLYLPAKPDESHLEYCEPAVFSALQKPLIQVGVNALLENGQTFNTNNYFMRQK